MAYWIYQHLGNLSPPELDVGDEPSTSSTGEDDAGPRLRALGARVGSRVGGEPLGLLPRLRRLPAARPGLARGARSRRGPPRDGRRGRMAVDRRALARGVRPPRDREHASRVPAERNPPPARRGTRRFATAAGDGAAARLSERLRRAVDLEHWAAFNPSFERLCDWLRTVATRRGGFASRRPRSCCSAGTSTTRTVSEIELGPGARRAASSSSCAPPSVTRSRRRSGASSGSPARAPRGAVFSRSPASRACHAPSARLALRSGADVRELDRGARPRRALRAGDDPAQPP